MTQNRDISSTFLKGMAVLKAFDDTQAEMTIADLSRKTNLDAATTRRLVLTLVHLGYLKKIGRDFSLTPRILVLAGSFLGANQFGRLVQPVLNRHDAEIGRDISLAMRNENKALLVAQSSSPNTRMTFGFTVGSQLPLLHTAIGRMLLALEPGAIAEQIVSETKVGTYTQSTTIDRDLLLQFIQDAGSQGYCVVRDEFENGVTGIAVPVSTSGAFPSVIGISDVNDVYQDEKALKDAIVKLKRCAAELSQSNSL